MLGRRGIAGERLNGSVGREPGVRAFRRRARRAWGVEALEGRALLSVYFVNRPGDAGTGAGYAGDLRYAIEQADQARGDSTILFAPSLNGQTITLTSGPLTIDKPSGTLTILGPGPGKLSVSGGGLSQVLAVTSSSQATISGLTITGGAWSQGPGGGLYNDGQLTLAGCTIAGNTDFGSGGGGIANGPLGTMTISESTISGNVASVSDGGGIANAGTMMIIRSTVSGDASRGGNGGGIANTGTLSICNSTISGNRATIYNGGGIYNTAALTLSDDTISNNTANFQGGGIVNQADLGGTIRMDNTIVAGNVSVIDTRTPDVLDTGDPQGLSLVGSHNLVGAGDLGSLSHTLVGVDPQLGPLQNNYGPTWTQAILPGSPAAGAGDPTLVPAGVVTDQRGFPRLIQGQLDIGAFELQTIRYASLLPPGVLGVPSLFYPFSEAILGLSIDPGSHPHGTNLFGSGTAVATSGGSAGGA